MGTRGRELGEKEIDIKVLLCRSGRKRRCGGSLLTCGVEVVPAAWRWYPRHQPQRARLGARLGRARKM